jgi:nanoRNase/pAp phosphatase (c-di-AMP/oligoRNAs hydrolase)
MRELKEAGVIDVRYISTGKMAADCLAKLLKRQKFAANLLMLGLREDTDSHNLAGEAARSNKRTQPHAEWECCE